MSRVRSNLEGVGVRESPQNRLRRPLAGAAALAVLAGMVSAPTLANAEGFSRTSENMTEGDQNDPLAKSIDEHTQTPTVPEDRSEENTSGDPEAEPEGQQPGTETPSPELEEPHELVQTAELGEELEGETSLPEPVKISGSEPKLSGSPQAGKLLTVLAGKWAPSGVVLSYEWLSNGVSINGANSAKYTVKVGDRGKKLSVRVTGTLQDGSSASKLSKSVQVLRLLKSAQPSIGGTSRWHKNLSVKPTGWTKGTKFTYQWYRNGQKVSQARAKKASYQIYNADWCQTLSVRVTGRLAGYETTSKTSKSHANAGCPRAGTHRIYAGQRLDAGRQIVSRNWKHVARMALNGKGYLLNHSRIRWKTAVGSPGAKMYLQPDGNLVVKNGNKVRWSSKTVGRGISYAAVDGFGELGLYTAQGHRVWSLSDANRTRLNNWGVVPMNQNDGRWAGAQIGPYRLGPVACVPTAFAIAASGYGISTNPYEVGMVMHNNGDFNRGVAGGGGWSMVAASRHFGLKAQPLTSMRHIKSALRSNRPVVAFVSGPASVTRPGSTHAVVLTGLQGDGFTTLTNPWGGWVQGSFPVDTVWNYQSWDPLDRNAGAVFWAIG